MTIEELLASKQTFYTKRWQSNDFYPVDKYTWDETEGKYHRWGFKKKDWGTIDNQALLSILRDNPCLISPDEFKDEYHYNGEYKLIIEAHPW